MPAKAANQIIHPYIDMRDFQHRSERKSFVILGFESNKKSGTWSNGSRQFMGHRQLIVNDPGNGSANLIAFMVITIPLLATIATGDNRARARRHANDRWHRVDARVCQTDNLLEILVADAVQYAFTKAASPDCKPRTLKSLF